MNTLRCIWKMVLFFFPFLSLPGWCLDFPNTKGARRRGKAEESGGLSENHLISYYVYPQGETRDNSP